MRKQLWRLFCGCCVLFVVVTASSADVDSARQSAASSYAYATNGVMDGIQGGSGSRWKLVLDESNLGGKELEIAEVSIPAGTVVPVHTHGAVEVIYVLSGTYGHEVNGKLYLLKPGMVGIVRPGDKVRHLVPKAGEAKLLIMWTPAGEAKQVLARAKGSPVAPVPEAAAVDSEQRK